MPIPRLLSLAVSFIAASLISFLPAGAQVERLDHGPLANRLNLPVYEWRDPERAPKGVVVAIHGLAMHATAFDACASKLASSGFIVVAPDLRGYGSWWQTGRSAHTSYGQSEDDIIALAQAMRSQYSELPIFLAAESLGGSLAIRIAANHPDLVDGMILSAPAIKRFHHVYARSFLDATLIVTNPRHQLDLSGMIKNYYSEDPQVALENMKDPMVRKHLNLRELFSSCRIIASTRHYIQKIPASMPVLVMQGQEDRMIKPASVQMLQDNLQTSDKTVKLFPKRGHLLLETRHPRPETMAAVGSWLTAQCKHHHAAVAVNHHHKIDIAVEDQGT
jgi:alpha-beta hydrolase superfamily lysophospholipase